MGIHANVLHNGRIRDASEPALRAGQLGLLAGWGVFTTLKVHEGALFAWERHWARLSRHAKLLNVSLPPDPAAVEADLLRLIEANGRPDCTLRLVFVRNGGGMWEGPGSASTTDTIALTADSKRWGESARLSIQPNARFAANEFAGAKVLSWAQNLTWAERAQREGFDETILLNERGTVAECTSANIFAVFGDTAYTPPLSDGCLAGITREILLEDTHAAERTLSVDDLYRADEVFITSTTRDLLPVREIAGRTLNSNPAVRERLVAWKEASYPVVVSR
ncbi:MAG TPA: aminotransferase class IV [Bryobacteraceae bacterium]|nr:aminotransferase class IV [Bryobacteraceae bacterium]